MNCEFCGVDPEPIVVAPIRKGELSEVFTCVDCAVSKGVYCVKHSRVHLGFSDDTSACIPCVEEVVQEHGVRLAGHFTGALIGSDKRAEIEAALLARFTRDRASMRNATLGDLPLVLMHTSDPRAITIARFVVTKAVRMKVDPEEVIKQVAEQGAKIFLS